jgi:flagellar hook-associated protein 3 FlgL
MYDSFISNLQSSMQQLEKLTQKSSTGIDVNKPSDAPEKIGRIISLRDSINNVAQYKTNVSDAVSYMTSTETALSSMASLLDSAHTTAVEAANSTYSDTDRSTMANAVENKIEELISLGNTQVEGKYIFSGYKTTTEAFTAVKTGTSITSVTYNGDSGLMPEEINKGEVMNKNVAGSELTAAGTDAFNTLIKFRDDLTANDTTAITADIDKLQTASDAVTAMNTDVGGKITRLDNMKSTLTQTSTTYTSLLSSLQDADITEVATQFQLQKNVYQAALSSISSMLQQTTLADLLR